MEAIKQYKTLIKQRDNNAFWEANIIDAHSKCKTKEDETLFYMYLTTPRDQFDPNVDVSKVRTLGDRMDDKTFKSDIKPLPRDLTQDFYQNGNETIIRTRRADILEEVDEDDEKRPQTPTRAVRSLTL